MTRIEIYRKKGRVVGYKATGHSGYAEYGEDIVCAALSMEVLKALQKTLFHRQEWKSSLLNQQAGLTVIHW